MPPVSLRTAARRACNLLPASPVLRLGIDSALGVCCEIHAAVCTGSVDGRRISWEPGRVTFQVTRVTFQVSLVQLLFASVRSEDAQPSRAIHFFQTMRN